jgi:predicted nucleic acid-binding protein
VNAAPGIDGLTGCGLPKPFDLIFERVKNEEWRALRDDFRTFLDESVINEEPAAERALIWAGALLVRGPNCMSDKCFVDTNVLVNAHDRAAGVKHQRARSLIEKLWNSGGGVLSTQVLEELCINVRRKSRHPLSVEETRRLIQDYSSWTIVIHTAESVLEALDIEFHHKISSGMHSLFKLLGVPVLQSSIQKI